MSLLFTYPGHDALGDAVAATGDYTPGGMELHRFPDGESLVRLKTDVKNHDVTLLCSLDRPDDKAMALMFFAATARELGAKSVHLLAPYLGYMRQDTRFHAGEAVTSGIFAAFLSRHFDSLVTVDPHLHRHKTMDAIYTIPARAAHAAGAIATWIGAHIDNPVLIGPDIESDQWVSDVAKRAGAPYTVLRKTRHGDRDVEISVPEVDTYAGHTPVLVDDIISTARTMIETVIHLNKAGMQAPVCIGVHAVFAGDAHDALKKAGAARIVTCNTIPHDSNAIDIAPLLCGGT